MSVAFGRTTKESCVKDELSGWNVAKKNRAGETFKAELMSLTKDEIRALRDPALISMDRRPMVNEIFQALKSDAALEDNDRIEREQQIFTIKLVGVSAILLDYETDVAFAEVVLLDVIFTEPEERAKKALSDAFKAWLADEVDVGNVARAEFHDAEDFVIDDKQVMEMATHFLDPLHGSNP